MPLVLPDGVTATVADSVLTVEGPKGQLQLPISPAVEVTLDDASRELRVALHDLTDVPAREARKHRAMWGTTRRLIDNMVVGVTQAYTKTLFVVGVGYAARIEGGKELAIRCGFANEIRVPIPDGITIDPPEPGNIQVTGVGQVPSTTVRIHSIDKQLVGQFAATVRRVRPPEPYKGKGIRYSDEEVKHKAGKALAAGSK